MDHTLMESFVWNRLTWGPQGQNINTKLNFYKNELRL